jgi:hypothetical protein
VSSYTIEKPSMSGVFGSDFVIFVIGNEIKIQNNAFTIEFYWSALVHIWASSRSHPRIKKVISLFFILRSPRTKCHHHTLDTIGKPSMST